MDTQAELVIDLNNLQEEFCRAAADVGWAHTLAGQSEADLQDCKDELERTRCRIIEFQRAILKHESIKPTEQILEEKLLKNQEYIAAQKRYVEAIRLSKTQKGQAIAYTKKADMLVSLGALVRAEMNLLTPVRNQ